MTVLSAQTIDPYQEFIASKIKLAQMDGFEVDPAEVNPALKPHCRAIVPWALAGGRRAIFASYGLHKTSMQIEKQRLALKYRRGPALICLPLGVRREFFKEAEQRFTGDYAVNLRFIRRTSEADEGSINLTNYESVREGKVDFSQFGIVDCDEAAGFRGFGGSKTFREFIKLFDGVPLRGVNTACPAPNEYIELLAYAAMLGIMDVGQAKTRFFKRDSENADHLTIHPHKEREFWLWVASWAVFLQKPSDLGFSDDGYDMPALDVRWHELATDHAGAGAERNGQGRLLKNSSIGVSEASKERRDSLPARMARLREIIAEDPGENRILWHDLEAERAAIEAAVPGTVSIHGTMDLEEREQRVTNFAEGRIKNFATKPILSGAGGNLQYHCARAVYTGIGFKFHDFIQSVHRIRRFGQARPCRIDLIYTEAERGIRSELERRWQQHDAQAAIMAGIIREYGLAHAALATSLQRSIGVTREEVRGSHFTAVNNDCVLEAQSMATDSVDLIVTSIPFSTQYEYTPSYNDFGHSEDNAQFWRQMDYLIPQLLRVTKPGRIAAVHVKDRIQPRGISKFSFQTVEPFSDECVAAFRRHGWGFLARKTIVTDVVRENNQTYRLGWTEQCKDGTKQGAGLPEYLLIFRKAPTDGSDGYADTPVVKGKPLCDDHGEPRPFDKRTNWKQPVPGTGYSRARWQLDAHGFTRSSGDRLLTSAELRDFPHTALFQAWRERSTDTVYDFAEHLAATEDLDHLQRLPATFMLLPPHSWHPDVWTDITRMRTLNGAQHAAGREMHLCPLQFDIVDRAIVQYSMKDELVFDPFGGLGTVALRALKLGRRGLTCELSPRYHADAVAHLQAAEREAAVPSLFDFLQAQEEAA